jgi:hypothetical protein
MVHYEIFFLFFEFFGVGSSPLSLLCKNLKSWHPPRPKCERAKFNWRQKRRLGNVTSLFVLRIDGFDKDIYFFTFARGACVHTHLHTHKYTRALFILNAFTSSEPSCFERVLFKKLGGKASSLLRARGLKFIILTTTVIAVVWGECGYIVHTFPSSKKRGGKCLRSQT